MTKMFATYKKLQLLEKTTKKMISLFEIALVTRGADRFQKSSRKAQKLKKSKSKKKFE